ncbi:outer membrane beta-barrel protein [Steroidobacter sp. S1-65]|uniref:Outer membrane beta-barrel protein n=1 Tax=Steroidobacter gossypii TaxID=2805490 RepID=A0ABS1X152_9GAMM|nr:outer membrane beta-barrel protein [Steroidobacter gossypii]MBM0106939.1 outer membrane beta-barrel protein [Steroidobacter gossypii]
MKRIRACAAWMTLALTCNVNADESGPYLSAGLGRVDAPDNASLGALRGQTDNDVWSWTVGVGYRFNKNIALELGYLDLGELESGNLTDPTGSTDARARAGFAADGATFALVGTFPIGRWEPYVKAGVMFSSTELRFSGSTDSVPFAGRITDDTEDPLYGAGVRFTVAEPLQVYLDLTYLDDVGEHDTGQSNYLNGSAGVLWRF